MKTSSSATGRGPAGRPKRQAKVIPLPVRRQPARRKRKLRIVLALIVAALAGAVAARFLLARETSSPQETEILGDSGESGSGLVHMTGYKACVGNSMAPTLGRDNDAACATTQTKHVVAADQAELQVALFESGPRQAYGRAGSTERIEWRAPLTRAAWKARSAIS